MRKLNSWQADYQKGEVPWNSVEIVPQQANLLKKFLKPGNSVLEIGCGLGNDAVFMMNEQIKYVGIDVSNTAITHAKSACPRGQFYTVSIHDFELNQHDVVYEKGVS